PNAPVEYRGEFQSIETAAPGIRLCEHLPKTAKQAQRLALIRSLTMSGHRIGDHHADTYYALTGRRPDRSFFVQGINRQAQPDDSPRIASAIALRKSRDPEVPGVVQLPARSGEVTGFINPGQFSGLLGPGYEP